VKLTYLTLIVLLLVSCGHKHKGERATSLLSNFLSITDNEDKGIKEIVGFYGGYCEYSTGVDLSTDKGKIKFFELKLTKSDVANKFSNIPEFTASNIAYLFYKNLKGENKNYDEIHSVLLLNKKERYESKYSRAQLEIITKKMDLFNKICMLIKNKNYTALESYLGVESWGYSNKSQFINNLQNVDYTFGNIKNYMPFGFRFETFDGHDVLDIFGVMIREKQNNAFCVKIDLKPLEGKIYFLDYNPPSK